MRVYCIDDRILAYLKKFELNPDKMKTNRIIAFLFLSCFLSAGLMAQSAEKVIDDYLNALGGKKKMEKITSMQMTATIDSDMFEADATTTVLNGKGYKMEMDVQGLLIESVFTPTEGWRTDPMAGDVVKLSDEEFQMGKGAIFVGGPFQDYKNLGMKFELVGKKDIDGVSTHHLRFQLEDSEVVANYFFDTKSHLLIRTVTVAEAQGMEMEIITDHKDYKEVEGGIKMAHVTDIDYGGQMVMTQTITDVKVNIPVDESIFNLE